MRQQDFKESDKIVVFLTKDDGKKSGVIRGVKKTKTHHGSRLEPFTCASIWYDEKPHQSLVSIRKTESLQNFYALRQNYHGLMYGSYFLEILYKTEIPEEESPAFYELLWNTLQSLEEAPQEAALLKVQFELQWLQLMGLTPAFEQCAQCQQPLWEPDRRLPQLCVTERHQLDVSLGGLICPKCVAPAPERVSLSPGTLCLWHALEMQILEIPPAKWMLAEWDLAFIRFYSYHMGAIPKSHALLPK